MQSVQAAGGRKTKLRDIVIAIAFVLGVIGMVIVIARANLERATSSRAQASMAQPAMPTAPPVIEKSLALPESVRSVVEDGALPEQLARLHELVDKRAWRDARLTIVALTPRFEQVPATMVTAITIEADRARSARAIELKNTFDKAKLSLSGFEFEVFNAAFDVLWAPENSKKDEDRMLASVGRKFGLRGEDVKDILIRHDDLMTLRLAEQRPTR